MEKDIYYVIGYPVKHSLSPKIQMQLAKEYDQDILFAAVEIAPEELEQKIEEFKSEHQVKGLSVTVPHKEQIFNLSDEADDIAKDVKAASNVIFTRDRKMIALNYDGLGIVNDIKYNHNISFTNKKILVVGAGGAAKAVIAAIIKESPNILSITNRTKLKVQNIKTLFNNKFNIDIQEYGNIQENYDIVINSTSSSIINQIPLLSPQNFKPQAFGYDLMYKEGGTVFTHWCLSHGIKCSDGKGMLVELSKAVFKKWRNI